MTDRTHQEVRWDVFVSHASEDKDPVAEPLAQALIEAGLRVWYDRIVLQMGDSLRQRIDEGLAESRFGIVILSPSFFAKHWPQQELNGLAQKEVAGHKVILPVWHELTAGQVRRYSPMLADRVAAQWSDGVASVVSQVVEVVQGGSADAGGAPKGGGIIPLPLSAPTQTSRETGSLVLLVSPEGKNLFVHLEGIEAASTLKLELVPGSPRERAFLSKLRGDERRIVHAAYDLTAISAQINSVSHTRSNRREVWKLDLTPQEPAWTMESALGGLSADQIAEMRARRILLDEKLRGSGREHGDLNDMMLDLFVRGSNTPIEVQRSPLPALYSDLKHDPALFVAAARLVAVLYLCLSGVVEHIFQLDLRLTGDDALTVEFEGQRRRQYSNQEPPIIRVEGICQLASDAHT